MVEIKCQNATLSYRGQEVLSGLSFHLPVQNHACIHGPIGSGKTMLMRSLMGLAQLKSGKITFYSNELEISRFEFLKQALLVDFTKPNKFFNPVNHFYQQRYHHQLEDESSKSITLRTFLELNGFSLDDQKVTFSLARENLQESLTKKLIQLSSGQRKKLQLLTALLQQPKVLLLDSPYIGLDIEGRNDLNHWLLELVNENDLQIILAADRRDVPDWIKYNIKLATRIPEANKNEIHAFNKLKLSLSNHKPDSDSEPILEIRDLNLKLGETYLFQNLNWKLANGERLAITGKNGIGKSTLMSLIYADNPKVYRYKVRMFGIRRGEGDNIWDVKRRIGFVSSELHIYFTEQMSCLEVIATGIFDTKYIPRKLTPDEICTIEWYAAYFDISHLLDKIYTNTSFGEQRVVLFIRALIKNPKLLLLDEPYQGFDPQSISKANNLINHIVRQTNNSIIFISHYPNEIPSCINRIIQLKDGGFVEI